MFLALAFFIGDLSLNQLLISAFQFPLPTLLLLIEGEIIAVDKIAAVIDPGHRVRTTCSRKSSKSEKIMCRKNMFSYYSFF